MISEKNDKSRALTGASNGRIDKIIRSDSQTTAAWAQNSHHTKEAGVSVPDASAVIHAKELADNGSRL